MSPLNLVYEAKSGNPAAVAVCKFAAFVVAVLYALISPLYCV